MALHWSSHWKTPSCVFSPVHTAQQEKKQIETMLTVAGASFSHTHVLSNYGLLVSFEWKTRGCINMDLTIISSHYTRSFRLSLVLYVSMHLMSLYWCDSGLIPVFAPMTLVSFRSDYLGCGGWYSMNFLLVFPRLSYSRVLDDPTECWGFNTSKKKRFIPFPSVVGCHVL